MRGKDVSTAAIGFPQAAHSVTLGAMQTVAENLWVLRFPLRLGLAEIGRTVCIVRLASGVLVIHSTAPFDKTALEAIRKLGRPGWLVEATLFHDTFARAGQTAFPEITYLAPEGFGRLTRSAVAPLQPPPAAWRGELEVLKIGGMPRVNEHAFLHRPSRTLITADLVFNFGPQADRATRAFFRWAMGIRNYPGVSRLFRLLIRDKAAFTRSVEELLAWDFDRLIVGHGEIIATGARQRLAEALARFAASART